jgi:hypothetical protein
VGRVLRGNPFHELLAGCPGHDAAALAVLRADGIGWSDLGDTVRVLSIAQRKSIEREWRLDQDTERALTARASVG